MPSQPIKTYPLPPRFISILITKALSGEQASFTELINLMCVEVDEKARIDELQRVRSATLDADTDVWSTTDDDRIISLTDRIKQLDR
jgi:hypothetical protein